MTDEQPTNQPIEQTEEQKAVQTVVDNFVNNIVDNTINRKQDRTPKIFNATTMESLALKSEMKDIFERLELKGLQVCKHLMLKSEDVLDMLNSIPPHVLFQIIADVMKKAEMEKLELKQINKGE